MESRRLLNWQQLIEMDILCCPSCSAKIINLGISQLICSNDGCSNSNEGFLLVDNKPVLIDFNKSIVEKNNFISSTGKSLVKRREQRFWKGVRFFFQGESGVTKSNVAILIEKMKILTNPRILIVGGGEIGSGLKDIYRNFQDSILSFDIYNSPNIEFVADAHSIPLKSNSFDLVIIQAVLEHVVDPQMVVSECARVIKPNGLIYAETPFMQQVHEGPFDFTRYTESGHRFLFKDFKVISAGHTSGVGVALIWSLSTFFTAIFRNKIAGKFSRVFFFWLRFFDNLIPSEYQIDGACGVYFMGEKERTPIETKSIIGYYRGSQKI